MEYSFINRFLKGRARVPAFFFNIIVGLIVGTCLVSCSQDVSENPAGSSFDDQLNIKDESRQVNGVALDLEWRVDVIQAASAGQVPKTSENPASSESDQLLVRAQQALFGDLNEIRERRLLRVLVAFGRTNFFFDKGMPRGFEYDLLMEYEKELNKGISSPEKKTKLVFIPVPFDQIFIRLLAGEGDIAAAGLTVTDERLAKVRFSDPYIKNVKEILVASNQVNEILSLDDLAGKTVGVRKGSSYVDHLNALNDQMIEAGRSGIEILEADERLSTEDILEMVDSGSIKYTVADNHIASIWGELLKNIRIYPNIAVNSGGQIAWAVRPATPKLLESLNRFVRENKKGSLLGNILFTRYYKKNRWITNPVSKEDRARLTEMRRLFEKYGAAYEIDWLKLVAQGYQESRLDQSMRSSAGAIGVMQLLQSTASDKSVGIDDVTTLDNNIHAGAKYMAHLLSRYVNDPGLDPAVRMDLAWASYNAGPSKIRRLRALAGDRGLDPNKWFANVEVIAAEKIGRETVDYVRNINKYYLAYKMYFDELQASSATTH
ncbi:MAG: transporter substrate-binding domain-containing protein [Proteobacteria bacterium]|nr:transporter substrate-binding domain-containing protein [Pseudomonadota bacterium]MBT6066043.1 transporter substrate-binding domain-containing protein [Pseudomonadota bacterium]